MRFSSVGDGRRVAPAARGAGLHRGIMLLRRSVPRRVMATVLAVGGVGLVRPLPAQATADREPAIRVTPYVGYAVFGDYFEGMEGVTFTNENAPIVGAQLGAALTPTVALVGHLGYARSNWRLNDVPLLGDVNLAEAGIWLYDVGVQLRLPTASRGGAGVTPFAQLGVGAIRYTLGDATLAELIGADDATNVAGNVGIGADVRLGRAVGLQLMVRDYVAAFRSVEARGFRAEGRVAHSVTFTAGATFGF